MVFDINDLYVKGREWKGRSRPYFYCKTLDRRGRETGKERKGGEG